MPYACAFARARADEGITKSARTLQSRIEWWKLYCSHHHIDDYELKSFHPFDKDFTLMCYAISLSLGNTIKAMTISTKTLKKYLKAAGDIVGVKTTFDHESADSAPNKGQHKNNDVSEMIRSVVKEHHRWEKMPNRREPITTKMVKFWIEQAKTADPDSFTAAMADWMVLGIKVGFRKSE